MSKTQILGSIFLLIIFLKALTSNYFEIKEPELSKERLEKISLSEKDFNDTLDIIKKRKILN